MFPQLKNIVKVNDNIFRNGGEMDDISLNSINDLKNKIVMHLLKKTFEMHNVEEDNEYYNITLNDEYMFITIRNYEKPLYNSPPRFNYLLDRINNNCLHISKKCVLNNLLYDFINKNINGFSKLIITNSDYKTIMNN
jgi:hypothetical protein